MSGSSAATFVGIGITDNVRQGWDGFVRVLLGAAALVFLAGYAFLLAVDPYDSGRFGLIKARSVHDQYPFTGNVSRARDQRFDAAVFGNSHVQMLKPERLDALTGLRFVSLSMPATRSRDSLDSLRWFLANRATPPKAVVLGIDHFWCLPETPNTARFPTWLYSDSNLDYLAGLVRYRNFEVAMARIKFLRSHRQGIRPDGYWDYTPIYEKLGLADPEASHRKLQALIEFPPNPTGRYPGMEQLRQALATLPPSTRAVLVWPPVYRTAVPAPGTPGAQAAATCRAELAKVAASRPNTALVVLWGTHADDPANFFDQDHVRDNLASVMETDVAQAYNAMKPQD